MKNKMVKIEPRGDDIKCFQDIINLIPTEREDLLSYICYLQVEFLEQLGIDKRPYDVSLWSDEDIDKFLDTGINPYDSKEVIQTKVNNKSLSKTSIMLDNIKNNGFYGALNKID